MTPNLSTPVVVVTIALLVFLSIQTGHVSAGCTFGCHGLRHWNYYDYHPYCSGRGQLQQGICWHDSCGGSRACVDHPCSLPPSAAMICHCYENTGYFGEFCNERTLTPTMSLSLNVTTDTETLEETRTITHTLPVQAADSSALNANFGLEQPELDSAFKKHHSLLTMTAIVPIAFAVLMEILASFFPNLYSSLLFGERWGCTPHLVLKQYSVAPKTGASGASMEGRYELKEEIPKRTTILAVGFGTAAATTAPTTVAPTGRSHNPLSGPIPQVITSAMDEMDDPTLLPSDNFDENANNSTAGEERSFSRSTSAAVSRPFSAPRGDALFTQPSPRRTTSSSLPAAHQHSSMRRHVETETLHQRSVLVLNQDDSSGTSIVNNNNNINSNSDDDSANEVQERQRVQQQRDRIRREEEAADQRRREEEEEMREIAFQRRRYDAAVYRRLMQSGFVAPPITQNFNMRNNTHRYSPRRGGSPQRGAFKK